MSANKYALENIRFGSVCSGIEAASVAWHHLGWRAAWLAEVDAAASAVLAQRFPDVPNLGDMTGIAALVEARIVEAPNVLVGGTPCQGYSVAGLRGGLSDPRGQLTLSFVEILDAIDDARRADGKPECIAVWENVPGVLSMGDNAFGHFLASLAGEDEALVPSGKRWSDAGLVVGPKRAVAWRILDAQFFGLAQRRKRVIVVASARDGFDPGEILFEFDGVRRDSAPSRQARQDASHAVAPCLVSSGRGVERTGDPRGQDPVIGVRLTNRLIDQPIGARMLGFGHYAIDETASTIKARDFKDATDLVIDGVQCVTGEVTHTLTAEGFDASEDGTGRGNPIVHCFDARQTDVVQYGNVAGTIDTNGYSQAVAFQGRGSNLSIDDDVAGTLTENCDRASGGAPCVAFTAKDHGQDATEELSPTLRSGGHTDSHANGGVMPAVAYSIRTAQTGANGIGVDENISPTLDVSGAPSVAYGFQPRIARNGRGDMGELVNALTAEAGRTGKGDAAPCVAYAIQERAICENPNAGPDGIGVREDVAYTLEARQVPQAVGHEIIPFDTTQLTHAANRSNPKPGDPCHPLAAGAHPPSVCGSGMAVRRLMPVECERLQGFPDGWTRIPGRFYSAIKVTQTRPVDMWFRGVGPDGKEGYWLSVADGPRYKQLGNSMAVHKMAWVGGRIKRWLQLAPFRELIG